VISKKLRQTDLNLLVALQVLLEERNVTRAAERLAISQPALSKILQQLRTTFEDELFTTSAEGMIPTPRAEAIFLQLPAALEAIESMLGSETFDPQTFSGTFTLLLPPVVSEALLPDLMAALQREAPHVQIITAEVSPDHCDKLKRGEADFVVYVPSDTGPEIHAEPIATLQPRCYLRRGHPLETSELTIKSFMSYPHVRLFVPGLARESTSLVDSVLGQYGMHPTILLETSQFAAAVGVLSRTDALLVANAGFAESGLYSERVLARELPAELKRMIANSHNVNRGKMSLLRHTRTARSPGHRWMRQLLMRELTNSAHQVDQPVGETPPPEKVSV
jgi:DNA-binding transcriptional LysR family regulator